MNDKEIREIIKHLELIDIDFLTDKQQDARLLAIKILEMVENASDEFPKEKKKSEFLKIDNHYEEVCSCAFKGYNESRSQCLAVHLKKVGELEATIEQLRVQLAGCGVEALGYGKNDEGKQVEKGDYGYSASLQDVRDLQSRYAKLKEENASKQTTLDKITVLAEELKVNITKDIEEKKQLHQQIERLRGALEKIVSLECTPYDCKCCPSEDIAKSALEEK